MTDQDKPEGDTINFEYVKLYEKLERDIPSDYKSVVTKIQQSITAFNENRFTREHQEHFLTHALPKIVTKLVKDCISQMEETLLRVQFLLRSFIDIVLHYGLPRNILPLLESFTSIMDPYQSFHFKKIKIPLDHKIILEKPICPPPKEWSSETVEDLVSYFGHHGFTAIFKHLHNENEVPCTLPAMHCLVTAVCTLKTSFLNQGVIEFCAGQLHSAIWNRLNHLTEYDLRSGQKEDFNKAINGMIEKTQSMMEKVMPQPTIRKLVATLGLNIALQCFQSPIFEKRIYGLTFITNLTAAFRPPGTGPMSSVSSASGDLLGTLIYTRELVDEKTLTAWLLENKILSSIFGASRHVEIIRRSGPILDFLARQDALDEENLNLCLECIVKAHSSVATKVLDLLTSASASLLPKHVDALLNFFSTLKAEQYDIHLVSFLNNMARAQLKDTSQKLKFLSLMWQIVDDASLQGDWCIRALKDLEQLVSLPEFANLRLDWVEKLVTEIKQNSMSISFCYQLLGNIVESFPKKHAQVQSQTQNHVQNQSQNLSIVPYQPSNQTPNSLHNQTPNSEKNQTPNQDKDQDKDQGQDQVQDQVQDQGQDKDQGHQDQGQDQGQNQTQAQTQPEVVTNQEQLALQLQDKYNLLEFFFEEYETFKANATMSANKEGISEHPDLDHKHLGGRMNYIEEIRYRLNIIDRFLTLLSDQDLLLTSTAEGWDRSFLKLWNLSVVNPLTKGEQELCLQWVIHLRDKKNPVDKHLAISNQATIYLFQKMLSLDPQKLDVNTYHCFQLYFCYSNVNENNIMWISPPMSAAGGTQGIFQIKQRPLIGYDAVWNIVLNSINDQVVEASMRFLNQLHENLDPELKRTIGLQTLRNEFISVCLSQLEQARTTYSKAIKSSNEQVSVITKRRIERCLSLFMHQTLMTSNNNNQKTAIAKCNKPVSLVVINDITRNDVMGTAQFCILEANGVRVNHSLKGDTLNSWSSPSFGPSEFMINTHTYTVLADIRKLIWERIVASEEEVKATGKKIAEEDLILKIHDDVEEEPSGDPKEMQKTMLSQTLAQLNVSSRQTIHVSIIPSIECRATNFRSRAPKWQQSSSPSQSTALPTDADEKATSIMDMFAVPKELAIFALRRKNWNLNTTAVELSERLPEIQMEATKAGVFNTSSSSPPPNIPPPQLDLDKASPSWILSNTQSCFESLFNILRVNDAAIQSKVWDLLHRIPPAAHITDALFTHQSQPSWNHLFGDQRDTFRLLYLLQTIDNFVFSPSSQSNNEAPVRWILYFIATGGTDNLVAILQTLLLDLPQESGSEEEIPQHTLECITSLLKILSFCISVCVLSDDSISRMADVTLATAVTSILRSGGVLQKNLFPKEIGSNLIFTLLSVLRCTSWQPTTYLNDSEGGSPTPNEKDLWISALTCYCFRLMTVLAESTSLSSSSIATLLSSQKQLKDIVDRLLLRSPAGSVRDEVASGIYHLAVTPHNVTLRRAIVDLLLSIEPDISEQYSWTTCGEYYTLLTGLISAAGKEGDGLESAAKLKLLVAPLLDAIRKRPIFESKKYREVDEVLRGKMMLLVTLLRLHQDIAAAIPAELMESGVLVDEIVNEFLFTKAKIDQEVVPHETTTIRSSGPKCKSRPSRIATFELIVELCRHSRTNYQHLVSHLFYLNSGKMKQIQSWQYHPSSNDKAACGYVGLNNLGATCYMNSLLQQFYKIPTLRYGILDAELISEDEMEKKNDKEEPRMLNELQYMFAFLQESEMKAYDPAQFCRTYKVDGGPISVSLQQDVDEFMNVMCSEIETQLKGTCYSHVLQRHFGVVLANEIRSVEPEFPYYSETREEFLRIPLEVKNSSNISQALDVLVACDKLEGDNAYNCEKYQRKLNATKRYCIKNLSNTLIFNLKRFEYDYTTDRKLKVNDHFMFPYQLNMKPWTQEALRSDKVSQLESTNAQDPEERPEWYYEYELVGVLVHSGSADSGHYYSYIRDKGEDGQVRWYEFNDSRVIPFNINSLARECYGGVQEIETWDNMQQKSIRKSKDIEKSAYMLFYQRKQQVPVDYWGDVSEDDENVSKEERERRKHVRKRARVQAENHVKNRDKRLVNGVPIKLHQKVWQENADFLRDRQFFDSSYFDFMLSFATQFSLKPQTDADAESTLSHFKIACRFVIEILCHAADKSTLFRWIPILRRILSHNVSAARHFLGYVLKPFPVEDKKVIPESDENMLKLMLLDCPHEQTRVFFSDLVTAALAALSPHEYSLDLWGKTKKQIEPGDDLEDVSICCQLIKSLWTMIDISRNVWRRFKQYFEVIKNFAMIDWYHRDYLRSIQTIKDFQDYFMNSPSSGKCRPQIMDSEHFPDLHEFYEILEVIVCGARNERQPETKDGQPILEDLGDDFYRTPMSMPGKLNSPLNSIELNQFFDNTFFSSLIEMDYHGPSMGRILCHASYECLSRSQYVVHQLLSLFKTFTTNKLPVYSRLLYPLLFINDSLQARRIHWLLSPFKLGFSHSIISSASTGVLGILRNEERQGVYIIHFLMHSMLHSRDNQPPSPPKQEPQVSEDVAGDEAPGISGEGASEETNTVYKYLLNKRSDLYWMKDFLAGKLDNETIPKTIMDDEVDTAEADIHEHFPGPQSTVTPRQLYVVVSKLVDQAAAGTSSLWEREEGEYMRKIETLQNELRKIVSDNSAIKHKIQTVQQYYRQKAPAIPPPESDIDDQAWVMVERDTVPSGTQLAVNSIRAKASESGSFSLDNAELGKGMASVIGQGVGLNIRTSDNEISTNGSTDGSGREDSGHDGHRTPRSKGTTLGGPSRDGIQRRKSESDIDPDQYPKQMLDARTLFANETNGTTTSTTTTTTVVGTAAGESTYQQRAPEAEVVEARARSLLEVFGHLPLEVIKVALSHVSWNSERAANNLFDDDNVKNYTKEAEDKRKTGESPSRGPERPGKSGKDMDLAEP